MPASNPPTAAPAPRAFAVPASYDAARDELHWQQVWARAQVDRCPPSAPAHYVLEMFPYPSGDLHMGHVRNYTLGDVFARFARLEGKTVLHPMGWDSFGLPAENQAIREGIAPQVRTPKNIARMREQMQRMGLSYDWHRELASHTPAYYRWNQWFFIELWRRNLVYRRRATVNFCPGCQTVLANEQVGDDGTCWRGHAGVTTKAIAEWAFRITAYAQQLHDGLDRLEAWPARIINQQRNWLGRSVGARIAFGSDAGPLEIFTTRLDTVFGCTYLVLAPEHAHVATLTAPAQQQHVAAFVARMRQLTTAARTDMGADKQGVFLGSYATHPYTGERVPIWLANYVLADYGSGAVMAVPAHDARDLAFAHKYGLPVRQVVVAAGSSHGDSNGPRRPSPTSEVAPLTDDGIVVDAGPHSGKSSVEVRHALADWAAAHSFGGPCTTWHLRDWGFSRQRYWGTPIPIIYCDTHGAVPVPQDALPVVLPHFDDAAVTGTGGAPLAKLEAFWSAPCPTCGAPGRRDTDTMDTFVDSAWYFARFLSPDNADRPFDIEAAGAQLPVDVYVGGPEHAVMHLLYFRFWTRIMRDLGLVYIDEPVRRLVTQGMVNAPTFRCPSHGYQPAADFAGIAPERAVCRACHQPLRYSSEKMSKSKYNGIDPMDLVARYGADTARLYVLFAAPPEKDLEWSQDGIEGLHRFIGRVWRLVAAQGDGLRDIAPQAGMQGLERAAVDVRRAVHRALAKVTDELRGRNHFNTAIAAMMELTNALYAHGIHLEDGPTTAAHVPAAVRKEAIVRLAQMLTPFAPHLAEAMWHAVGGEGLVVQSRWPVAEPDALMEQSQTVAVQVQGKLRGNVTVPIGATRAVVEALARQDANIARHLADATVARCIWVPGRLLNFVLAKA